MNKKGMWTTRKGKKLKIKEMKTGHIYNCACFLLGHTILDPLNNDNYTDKEMVARVRYLIKKKDEFLKEFNKRKITGMNW